MSYFWCCPDCGANLDPGERCDCRENRKVPPTELQLQDGEYTNDNHECTTLLYTPKKNFSSNL